MEYQEFEKKLISDLLKNNKKCYDKINDNKLIVEKYLQNTEKPFYIEEIVKKFNNIIINDLKKFSLIQDVLNHELFKDVLAEFRKSDVLIRAIKEKKTNAVKWLMTMDMDYCSQDENGVTALMQATNDSSFLFVVKEILRINKDVINITDNDGNTALFYSNDKDSFSLLCEAKPNLNHINNNGDTPFIKCCKKKLCPNFNYLLENVDDINYVNKKGKTALMYLVEHGNHNELSLLCRKKPKINYKNQNNETAVSILIKKFKEIYDNNYYISIEDYAFTMDTLISNGCNFNIPIDKEGNTPIMFFIMAGDYFATTLLLENYKRLDLSIKNEHGINASYLVFSIYPAELKLKRKIFNFNTFDYDFVDNDKNTMVMHFLVRGKVDEDFKTLLERKKIKSNEVNNKNENALIIATKLGLLRKCECLFESNDVNQQDYLGNTALYYAIKLKDRRGINMLRYYKADPNIKNYQGVSALDIANESQEEFISEALKNPVKPEQMDELIKKEGKSFIFEKKKTTDEKLVDYIMEYQVKNYKQEYEYCIKNKKRSYTGTAFSEEMLHLSALCYMRLYSVHIPNRITYEKERKKEKRNRL
ncbi:ankyrin [Anaeromyces robustus]|uniref:Ankyrin n=1 Tax=Anaeromyces robustus TaxID=1754192 RepID=A0A1Y1WGM6_9FUNG|nr:ankyrin [Anaeromyces robustus]|eukprot:ORX72545.1 ankyrin [Anaeromyces robustus]